jgi:hypothetical protein
MMRAPERFAFLKFGRAVISPPRTTTNINVTEKGRHPKVRPHQPGAVQIGLGE